MIDYCITHQDQFSKFSDFKVVPTTQIMVGNGIAGVYTPSCIPDHSLLSWKVNMKVTDTDVGTMGHENNDYYDKFDLKHVGNDFMNNPTLLADIDVLICRIEQNTVNLTSIDNMYTQWCELIKVCMYDEIPFKTLKHGGNARKYKAKKPWWNTELSISWVKMCEAENKWLKCTSRTDKILYKAEYVKSRKSFDQKVQRCKRKYWFSLQNDLLEECDVNPNEFWRSIGKIGVSYSGKKNIPEEVILENGEISADISEVLEKWKNDFCSLFNPTPEVVADREPTANSVGPR